MTLTKQQYVLVDFENVQAVELERIKGLPVKVVFFVGQSQKTVPIDLFQKACAINGCVEVVKSVGFGKNALDFQMACYAGRIAEREPEASIHFVSKDKGFDFVVQYLKAEKRKSERVDSFGSLAFLPQKVAQKAEFKSYSLQQKTEHVLSLLGKVPATTRPRKISTLHSSVNAMFGKQLDEATVKEIMDKLITDGLVVPRANNTVTYDLGAAAPQYEVRAMKSQGNTELSALVARAYDS